MPCCAADSLLHLIYFYFLRDSGDVGSCGLTHICLHGVAVTDDAMLTSDDETWWSCRINVEMQSSNFISQYQLQHLSSLMPELCFSQI